MVWLEIVWRFSDRVFDWAELDRDGMLPKLHGNKLIILTFYLRNFTVIDVILFYSTWYVNLEVIRSTSCHPVDSLFADTESV